ncbi:MAG: GntR family transcriptional regulator [Clostridia bacterium]|nr:GntR family transcriptional regulator [Clostridia bacterium]
MNIFISNVNDKPIYEQIYGQLKGLIIDGTLQEGDPLPSIRLLAKELRISVITTKRAYSELERDGFIVTVAGKGSFVAAQNTQLIREESLRKIEEHFTQAAALARQSGVSEAELLELLSMLYEGESL